MRRRDLLKSGLVAAGAGILCPAFLRALRRSPAAAIPAKSTFKLSIITDEITQDFDLALEIASREFGLGYVEIRTLWDKNVVNLDEAESAEARRLLARYRLQVTDIASPLFKVAWPGAPPSKFAPKQPQNAADFSFEQQDELLERGIALAAAFGTIRLRCFDFWRLDDPKPYRAAMDEKLIHAAERAAKDTVILLLENEYACNTATGAEALRTLEAVPPANFMLNWDPGNAAYAGELAFPAGYRPLPKRRIGHVHLKDVQRKPDGSLEWAAMGRGIIDYVAQFLALARDGYRGTMSLETHWNGAGSHEESSRQSMAGLKDLLRKADAL